MSLTWIGQKLKNADSTLGMLLALSFGVNVILGVRYRALADPASCKPAFLEPGSTVPPLRGKGLDGQEHQVAYDKELRPTVLYVFSPTCGWCNRNVENLRHLISQRRDRYRFVGVSKANAGETAAYLSHNGLTFDDVVVAPTTDSVAAYRLGPTPQSIVVADAGRVQKSWVGAYRGETAGAVEQFFSLQLPGLTQKTEPRREGGTSPTGRTAGGGR